MSFLTQTTKKCSATAHLLLRYMSKHSNPGIGHQIAAIKDAAEVIKNDPEGFGDIESDLMDAHKSYKQHELELKKQNVKVRHYIVERKYFRKEPLPNLLTYAEKEQIRFLHSSDKEEWTIEKLAEGFPASTETIYKILKANWSPKSSKRILTHDASVFKNWESFKKGEFANKMSNELHKHLEKFASRSPEDLKLLQERTRTIPKQQWQRPKSNEFSSIITLKSKENSMKNITAIADGEEPEKINQQHSEDTYLLGKIKNKKPITIKLLKNSLTQSLPDFTSNSSEKEATQNINNINDTGIINKSADSQKSIISDFTEKFSSCEVVLCEKDMKKYEMSPIKERIHIPRKLWRKGATYRINDCYYDNDGEFLYRVPGMI